MSHPHLPQLPWTSEVVYIYIKLWCVCVWCACVHTCDCSACRALPTVSSLNNSTFEFFIYSGYWSPIECMAGNGLSPVLQAASSLCWWLLWLCRAKLRMPAVSSCSFPKLLAWFLEIVQSQDNQGRSCSLSYQYPTTETGAWRVAEKFKPSWGVTPGALQGL
jgi:hypothetical protein